MTPAPVREVRAAAYRIPTDAPEADGTLSWDATTLVVVHAGVGAVDCLQIDVTRCGYHEW